MRSRRLKGTHEDSGRWVKCWHCGFPVDTTRVSLGPGNGVGHVDFPRASVWDNDTDNEVSYTDATMPGEDIVSSGDPMTTVAVLDGLAMAGVVIENGADGEPITDYYTPRKAVVHSGCPFCGCRNL